MVCKSNQWKSDADWIFLNSAGGKFIFTNNASSEYLGVNTEDKVVMVEILGQNVLDIGQHWKKGKETKDGFFTLTHISSKKVLTAVSNNDLRIKGNFWPRAIARNYFDEDKNLKFSKIRINASKWLANTVVNDFWCQLSNF